MFVPSVNLSSSYLFILLIQTIGGGPSCVYDAGNGKTIDTRNFGYTKGKGPKYGLIPNTSPGPLTLNWNGCFPYSKSDGGNCTDAAACYSK
jgi:hypothetical protein